jgi:hypothetical protein
MYLSMMNRPSSLILPAAALLFLLSMVAGQPATMPAVSGQQISAWLSDLSSFEYVKRESARIHLMQIGADQLDLLRDQIRKIPRLTPSQAVVLRGIVQEIFLSGDDYERDPSQGFLGILMDFSAFESRDSQQPNDNGQMPGVVVADRIPGFCAARSLRDGDVILGIPQADAAFRTPSELQAAIRGLLPGALVRLQLLRQGKVIEVSLTLDHRPSEATADALSLERLRARRADKFAHFWQDNFQPLLHPVKQGSGARVQG